MWGYNRDPFVFFCSLIVYRFCAEVWYLSSFLLFRQGRKGGRGSCLICQRVVGDPPITTYSFLSDIFSSVMSTVYQVSLPLRNHYSDTVSCFPRRPLFKINCILQTAPSIFRCNTYVYMITKL